MKLGLALPAYDLTTLRPLPVSEVAQAAADAEEAGFDSVWVMDHFFMTRGGDQVSGHDPLITLAYLARATSRVSLGVMVACNSFRSAPQLAREAAALADASKGRFLLGLGCGSQEAEHVAFGMPFERRVSRLAETMQVLPGLMEGRRVDYSGRTVEVRSGSIVTTAPRPPILLAAFGPRMMEIAASTADGWITGWFGANTARFQEQLGAYEAALAAAGRRRSEVSVVAGILAVPSTSRDRQETIATADRLSRGFAESIESRGLVGTPGEIAAAVHAYATAGTDMLVLSLSPANFARFPSITRDVMREVVSAAQSQVSRA